MDNKVIRKRLNTFKSSGGTIRSVCDEVIIDVLRAWENWSGTTADLYRELGLSKMQLVTLLKKAKRLVRDGVVPEEEFKQVEVGPPEAPISVECRGMIELCWESNKVTAKNGLGASFWIGKVEKRIPLPLDGAIFSFTLKPWDTLGNTV